jgi:hypothetical protein
MEFTKEDQEMFIVFFLELNTIFRNTDINPIYI